MISSMMILAYLGPETMLPMTSVVAGVVGVLMLLGRNSYRWASEIARGLISKVRRQAKPHAGRRKIGTGPVGTVERPRVRV